MVLVLLALYEAKLEILKYNFRMIQKTKIDINYTERDSIHNKPIYKNEIEEVIREMKSGKTCGPGSLPRKIIKIMNDSNSELLLNLFNEICEKGKF